MTALRRSGRSVAPGVSNDTLAFAIRAFAPCDPLLHCLLGHEEGPRNPCQRYARDHAQGQRDLLRHWQDGVTADEEEPQDVVRAIGHVDPLGNVGLRELAVSSDGTVNRAMLARNVFGEEET